MQTLGTKNRKVVKIFYTEDAEGLQWYAVKGSKKVNATFDLIFEGIEISTLKNVDSLNSSTSIENINNLTDLID